ncbi:unnamed protein product [Trichogramma brassicae]|uniref:Uncharacterized protein n=1 Tax=Trichogramma brassicae TaxID=86971 RepID=A0A6H5HV13_9HYME|nr:unnamed protein product [Trichogramma brassicae]
MAGELCRRSWARVAFISSCKKYMYGVARAPMQGIKQFNGKFGCNWCKHPAGSPKYPLIEYDNSDLELDSEPRQHDEIEQLVKIVAVVKVIEKLLHAANHKTRPPVYTGRLVNMAAHSAGFPENHENNEIMEIQNADYNGNQDGHSGSTKVPTDYRHNLRKLDWESFNNEMEQNKCIFNSLNYLNARITDKYDIFVKTINDSIEKSMPKNSSLNKSFKTSNNKSKPYCCWWNDICDRADFRETSRGSTWRSLKFTTIQRQSLADTSSGLAKPFQDLRRVVEVKIHRDRIFLNSCMIHVVSMSDLHGIVVRST